MGEPLELPEYNIETTIQRIMECSRAVGDELGTERNADEYEARLARVFRDNKLQFARQYPFGVPFYGPKDRGFYADFVVEGRVLLELKAMAALTATDTAEALSYLAESGADFCLLINFGRRPLEILRFDAAGAGKAT
jgi:GxxExxY protein